jgi:putative flippase GtrA
VLLKTRAMELHLPTEVKFAFSPPRNVAQKFLTYTAVGAVASACHYLLLILQVEVLHFQPLVSSTFAFIGGALTSYILNSTITFGDCRNTSWPLAKFLAIASVGLALNGFFMTTIITIFQVHYLIAQAGATAIVLLWNFGGNFLWTFGNRVNRDPEILP